MDLKVSLICWLVLGSIIGYVAHKRGKNPYLWFGLGMFLGIFGFVLLLIRTRKSATAANEAQATPAAQPSSATLQPEAAPIEAKNALSAPLPDPLKDQLKDPVGSSWHYLDATNKQQGPIGFRFLKLLWDEKNVTHSTYVWTEGMPEWKKIQQLPTTLTSLSDGAV